MKYLKDVLKKTSFFKKILQKIDIQIQREAFIVKTIKSLDAGKTILDAGCGSQRYKKYCSHLDYKSQDFGKFTKDEKETLDVLNDEYQYGDIDYLGNIWDINVEEDSFDAILCTEVFEHIPYPNETIFEFSRVLKKDGILILTAPSNSLRHMDPFYFYSGFSDRWFEHFLSKNGFEIISIEVVGDYYSWRAGEISRTALINSFLSKIILVPAFLYFFYKKSTEASVNSLCAGYNIIAKKL